MSLYQTELADRQPEARTGHEYQHKAMRRDVLAGLSRPQKFLPSRWLYDDFGSELFEEITQLREYYPTRTETGILRKHALSMATFAGAGTMLIEYGAGAGIKTELLLDALEAPAAYVPIDIAGDFLHASAQRIASRFSHIPVHPVTADFTAAFDLPADLPGGDGRTGFFPGSTIGNLSPAETFGFLAQMRRHTGPRGRALIGIDLRKSLDILIPAYDDAAGITEAFNKNFLTRINRELDGTFNLALFDHEARWNGPESAVEMHLVSAADQIVHVCGERFHFALGETIHTESSRKYSITGMAALAEQAGWRLESHWSDPRQLFAVVGLV